jgi:alkylation response protein AidB-like acyl-CoA dehydrogenase
MTVASQDVAASDLPARAESLIPLVDEQAQAAEEKGALTDAVVEEFHRTGLISMWVPRSLGGAELDPVSSLEVIE